MISRYIPGLQTLQKMLTSSTDGTLTMVLLVIAFLMCIAAFTLPAGMKGVILGWVIFP